MRMARDWSHRHILSARYQQRCTYSGLGVAVPVYGSPKDLIGLLCWVELLIVPTHFIQQRHRIEVLVEEGVRVSSIVLS